MFDNVMWPTDCIYNIDPKDGSSCEGVAEIEHHYDKAGSRNVWIQRRQDKIEQIIMEYAEYAKTRVSTSG